MTQLKKTLTLLVESPTLIEDAFVRNYVDAFINQRIAADTQKALKITFIAKPIISSASVTYKFATAQRLANIYTLVYTISVDSPDDESATTYLTGLFRPDLPRDKLTKRRNDKYNLISATIT